MANNHLPTPNFRWPDEPPIEGGDWVKVPRAELARLQDHRRLQLDRDELVAALEAVNELEWTEDPPQPLRARVRALLARVKGR